MEPVSGMISGVIRSPSTVADVKEPPKAQRSGDKTQARLTPPAGDEYVPEEKQEPSGRYWLGTDDDGKPKIYFDDPEQAAGSPKKLGRLAGADSPDSELPDIDSSDKNREANGAGKKAAGSRKAEICRGNTDAADHKIEELRKKKEKLDRQLDLETDDTKIKELERKLAQVESELRQKDNDTYRRQHSTFS